MKHINNGACPKCKEILDKYPNMHAGLRGWFILFQAKHPEAHISCAGRGYAEQTALRARGASRAEYGQSAHNYNCALDLFENANDPNIYESKWFKEVLEPELPDFLRWYGEPGSPFFELPHVEVRNWRELKAKKLISLVEEDVDAA